ncbi:MAG: hypothetical protein WCI51_05600 [Lentisphaerota bacterium]
MSSVISGRKNAGPLGRNPCINLLRCFSLYVCLIRSGFASRTLTPVFPPNAQFIFLASITAPPVLIAQENKAGFIMKAMTAKERKYRFFRDKMVFLILSILYILLKCQLPGNQV